MKLNCKQGDLAVIVTGPASGYVVRCVSRYDGPWRDVAFMPGWELDREVPTSAGPLQKYKADKWLRPLRDNPGQDETLHWLDVPTKETA